jgi:hypothetical protein
VLGRDGGLIVSATGDCHGRPRRVRRIEEHVGAVSGSMPGVGAVRGAPPAHLAERETRSVHVRARDVAGALVLTAVLVGGVIFLVLGSVNSIPR